MAPRKRRSSRLLLAVLILPAVAVAGVAAIVLAPSETGARTPLALGTVGGVMHPIAGAFEPDDTTLEDCGAADYGCLAQAFGNLAYVRGPAAALAVFDHRVATDADFSANCHPVVHFIGSASLKRFGGDIGKTFAAGSSSCAAGYYHGILERAFVGTTSTSQLAARARSLCVGQGLRPFGYFQRQCDHGLGHGLMIQTGYDLPTALRVCGALPTRWDHLSCTNGVFMENADTRFGVRSAWHDDKDPIYPCREVHGLDRRHCYARVPTYALRMNDGSVTKAAETCAGLASPWSRYCFRGLGRDAIDLRSPFTSAPAKCASAGAREADCLYGAARYVADRQGVVRAGRVCAASPPATKPECWAGVGGAVGLVHATDATRARACAALTRPYASACLRGARAEVDPNADPEAWG